MDEERKYNYESINAEIDIGNELFPPGYSGQSVSAILQEGIMLGLTKFGTIFGAVFLWLITLFIPYLNVGTTIAILTMPVTLSKGEDIQKATYIFDKEYRNYMGEYFTLIGLKSLSLWPAYMFLVIPGIIISIGWSQALYLLFDKKLSPSDAMIKSSELTAGHKMTLFLVGAVYNIGFFLIGGIICWIVNSISSFLFVIVLLILVAVYTVGSVGCHAVIYRKLSK